MKKILLHTCCSPCACYPLEELRRAGFQVAIFFYNPNIHPLAEYQLRLAELKKYLLEFQCLELLEGAYDSQAWFELTRDLEYAPERGRRCHLCYRLRLEKTAEIAKQKGFAYFGSSLSISPHKSSAVISRLGRDLGSQYALNFYDRDWKKNDGFRHACQIAENSNFYRQNYCGCIYSKK